MELLTLFRKQAIARGLLDEDAELFAENVFRLVRDMDLRASSSASPESAIEEWRSTGIDKHNLLNILLGELGYESRLMMCTYEFTKEKSEHLPHSLQVQLKAGPIPDVHSFLRVETGGGWMDIDATWPLETKELGMPANEEIKMGDSMELACDPIEIFYVPNDSDPQSFEKKLIRAHCSGQIRSRRYFIHGMQRWVREASAH